MIGRRFETACERLGLNVRKARLTTDHFEPPRPQARAARPVLIGVGGIQEPP